MRKHGVRFADAVPVLEDEQAITIVARESDPDEERYISLGMDAPGRLLIVVCNCRDEETIRLIMKIVMISARENEVQSTAAKKVA